MKKFMKTCYKCGNKVKVAKCIKEGVSLNCLKCQKCGEEYFTSSELIKFDILTGKRKLVRKFGVLGDSTIMRFPNKILNDFKIKPGDYGIFEEKPEGILIKKEVEIIFLYKRVMYDYDLMSNFSYSISIGSPLYNN